MNLKSEFANLECHVGDARLAEGGDDVDGEEGHPAHEEDAHDDADRDGRFVVRDVARRRHRGAVHVHRPRHRPDALHVALRVQVQPAVNPHLITPTLKSLITTHDPINSTHASIAEISLKVLAQRESRFYNFD